MLFEDLFLGTFGVVVYPSPSLLLCWLPQILLNLMSLLHDKTVSSTFPEPVWSLGTQLERRGSSEFLESKWPLIYEAFNADDKLLIGNGQGGADE